jgi:Zn-dependent protease
MLLSQLFSNPIALLIYAVLMVLTIGAHEFAHAKAADTLGDPTPRLQGRLSLNPFVHIDPLGFILIFLAGFGWGKPVVFDPFNLKNPRRDAAIISLAGPLTNAILALGASLMMHIIPLNAGGGFISLVLSEFIHINILLGIFNLIPIAPLDGFKIVGGILNEKQAHEWYKLERYGFFFLLALILPLSGRSMLDVFLSPLIQFLSALLTG